MRYLLGLTLGAFLGCSNQYASPIPDRPILLGGAYVQPETLNLGRKVYIRNCMACHGMEGDGRGPASPGLQPPPRNLTEGVYRFAAVESGFDLPRDEELMRILDHGLTGTSMLSYDLEKKERAAVIQYIKTFSRAWFDPDSKVQDAFRPSVDPFAENEEEGARVGERVYHGEGACLSCHPAYLSEDAIQAYRAEDGLPPASLRENFNQSAQMASMAPDYLWDGVKMSSDPVGVYRTLLRGLAGSGMPAYEALLDDRQLWGLAHYVTALVSEGVENPLASSSDTRSPFGNPDLTQLAELPTGDEPGPRDSGDAGLASATAAAAAVKSPPSTMREYGCLGCHAVDSPRAGAGPSLYGIGQRMTSSEIMGAIVNPDSELAEGYEYARGMMSSALSGNGFYSKASESEIQEIVNYLGGI